MPPTLDVALDVAERAEREFSDQPSLQLSTEDDCQDQSGPAKHCCHRCGQGGNIFVFLSVEDCNDIRNRSTQHGATSESLHVNAHMSSHKGELRILSVQGKGEGIVIGQP
ncbi:unnamed protein product [Gadus morhua 'NCC']